MLSWRLLGRVAIEIVAIWVRHESGFAWNVCFLIPVACSKSKREFFEDVGILFSVP